MDNELENSSRWVSWVTGHSANFRFNKKRGCFPNKYKKTLLQNDQAYCETG